MADGANTAAPAAGGQSKGSAGAPPPEQSPSGEGGVPAAGAPAKPKSLIEEFNERLKSEPVKYKHKNQERQVASMEELLRKASMADAYQDSTQELVKLRQEAAAERQRQEALKGLKGTARIKALREMFGEELDNDIVEEVLSKARAEKEMGNLSPAEKALRAENEKLRSQADAVAREKQEALDQMNRQREEQATSQLREQLHEHLGSALQEAGIAEMEAPEFVPLLAQMIQHAAALRLPLDRATLAKETVKLDELLTQKKLQRKSPERLLGMLRSSGQLKPLIAAYVASVKAAAGQPQVDPQQPGQQHAPAQPQQRANGQQPAKKDWRAFWGSNPVPPR